MDIQKTGKLIREERIAKQMTQQELAEQLHVSVPAVSRWENGHGFPDISLLEPLSSVLGISISELVCGERSRNMETENKDDAVKKVIDLSLKDRKKKVRKGILITAGVCVLLFFAGVFLWNNVFHSMVNGTADYVLSVSDGTVSVDMTLQDDHSAVKSCRIYQTDTTMYVDAQSVDKSLFFSRKNCYMEKSTDKEIVQIAIPAEKGNKYSHDIILWEKGKIITPQTREIYDELHYQYENILKDPLGLSSYLSMFSGEGAFSMEDLNVQLSTDGKTADISINAVLNLQDQTAEQYLKNYAAGVLAFLPDAETVNLTCTNNGSPLQLRMTAAEASEYTGKAIKSWADTHSGIQDLLAVLGLTESTGSNLNVYAAG